MEIELFPRCPSAGAVEGVHDFSYLSFLAQDAALLLQAFACGIGRASR